MQQVIQAAVGVPIDQAGEHVGQIGLWPDAVEFAGLDQGGKHGPVLAAGLGSGEEGILAVQGQGPDGALDDVGVELDAAVVEEAAEASHRASA